MSIRKLKKQESARVEIVRAFSYKLNVGNYESRDFFCSQKSECSAGDASRVSVALQAFCKAQVLAAVREYQVEVAAQFGPQKQEKK